MPKKLLLGATDFAEPHLDDHRAVYAADSSTRGSAARLASFGGNYHRWTLVDFSGTSTPGANRYPFKWDGSKFVMTEKDTTWWANFTEVLDIAAANNIVLQIEFFDPWNQRSDWYTNGAWCPTNNNHYGLGSGSGMPATFATTDMAVMAYDSMWFAHTGTNSSSHPTMGGVAIHSNVKAAQERFIGWVVDACQGYDVLYQVSNESPAPNAFADFVADTVHATDPDAIVTHMSVDRDLTTDNSTHARDSSKFQFADSSQNDKYITETGGLTLDESFTALRNFRNASSKPVNVTKVYNSHAYGNVATDHTGYTRMGMFVMGGVASAAMHPVVGGDDFTLDEGAGTGMTDLALNMIACLRWVDDNAELGDMYPDPMGSKWANRPTTNNTVNQVSAWAMEGADHIAIFMNGAVANLKYNTLGLGDTISLRWKSCKDGDLSGSGSQSTQSQTAILNPFPSGEMAVLVITKV